MSVAGHLLQTKVTLAPGSSAKIEFEWISPQEANQGARLKMGGREGHATSAPPSNQGNEGIKKEEGDHSVAQIETETRLKETGLPDGQKDGKKAYTADEVAKHNKPDDCWVMISGQVLDVTKFLPDHPGGEKAILLYAGRDATEEFNMLHDPKVISKYAADTIIGTVQ